jgi:transposase
MPKPKSKVKASPVDYDPDFRRSVVQMVLDGKSPLRIAQDLGIARSMIYRWRDAALAAQSPPSSTDANGPQDQPLGVTAAELAAENARLRRQLLVVEQEREILKKALNVLSRQP